MLRLIHQWSGYNQVMEIAQLCRQQSVVTFLERIVNHFEVDVRIEDNSNPISHQSTVYVCTHHTGPLDFLAIYPYLKRRDHSLKVVANKLLTKLKPLETEIIAVNPLSAKKRNLETKEQLKNHLRRGNSVLIFPAGKVAGKINGRVKDFSWRYGTGEIVRDYADFVVPIYLKAENSTLFYAVRKFFPKLSMLFLLRTLNAKRNKMVTAFFGEAIPTNIFKEMKSADVMKYLQEITYKLDKGNICAKT